jgi:hypothetical protein
MKAPSVPILSLTFSVDIELEYDSFNGKTPEQVADALQDDIHELLWDIGPSVDSISSTVLNIELKD